jgi:hypothetical protein
MKKIFAASMAGVAWAIPLMAFAQAKTLKTLIDQVTTYFNYFLVLMMGFAIVMFVWYVIKYFIRTTEDHKEAGLYVMYSVIGFFVILSMWGIVNILQNTFGLQNDAPSWRTINSLFPGGGNRSGSPSGGSNTPFDPETGLRAGGS